MKLHERLLWLASISSATGEEKLLADEIGAFVATLDLPEAPRRYGDSWVVPLAVASGGPSIVLDGHLDVAFAAPSARPRLEDGRVYGPGVADMKSGLAVMLDLAERPPAGLNLTAVFHARGEGGYHANDLATAILPADRAVRGAELAVVLAPTDNGLQYGCAGSTHATFLFKGERGHSGQIKARHNAIHAASYVLNVLATTEAIARQLEDGFTWYEHIEATTARATGAGALVPDELYLNLHHTYPPSMSTHDSQDRLIGFAHGSALVRFEDLAPPAGARLEHPLAKKLEASGVASVGPRLTWTDVACFEEAGVPAVNFGPGTEAQAHRKDEWTDLAALARARDILDRWFTSLGATFSTRARPARRKPTPPARPAKPRLAKPRLARKAKPAAAPSAKRRRR